MKQMRADLSDIIDASFLQAILNVFSARTKMASAILDDDARPITFELNHCQFCRQLRRTPGGLQRCRASDAYGIEQARIQRKLVFYVCRNGLVDFCGPITVNEKVLGYFFGAQFRCSRPDLSTPPNPTLGDIFPLEPSPAELAAQRSLIEQFHATQLVESEEELRQIRKQAEDQLAQINGIVQNLHEWHSVEMVHDFMRSATQARRVDDLLSLIVDGLPRMMNAGASSIFTVHRDEPNGCERLVLRRTSYLPLKGQEDSAWYDRGEGLTGWVWKTGRSLRITNLEDKAELSQYEGLAWKHKYDDSEEHTSFLAAPIFTPLSENVIGVIRVPRKVGRLPFTLHDEIFLNFLARHLGWAMQCQTIEESRDRALGPASLASAATQLAGGLSFDQVLTTALQSSLTLFGREDRLHFVNILERDGTRWRIQRTGGDLSLQAGFTQRVFSRDQGATGVVLRTQMPYISSDLDEALRKGEYVPAADHGASVIAAPIIHDDELYGAIAVVSARKYAFDPDRHLSLLTSLSVLTGAAIRNSRMHESMAREWSTAYSLFARAALHYLRNKSIPMERQVEVLGKISNRPECADLKEVTVSLQRSLDQIKDLFSNFKNAADLFETLGTPRTEDLNHVVKEAVDSVNDERVSLVLVAQPLPVSVDRAAVGHVLCELLGNALRHVPQDSGRVSVTTQYVVEQRRGASARVVVEDNGPGIPMEWKDVVFADGYTTEAHLGHMGLGLFFARFVASFSRGRIWEDGAHGHGARFTISLPVKE